MSSLPCPYCVILESNDSFVTDLVKETSRKFQRILRPSASSRESLEGTAMRNWRKVLKSNLVTLRLETLKARASPFASSKREGMPI